MKKLMKKKLNESHFLSSVHIIEPIETRKIPEPDLNFKKFL